MPVYKVIIVLLFIYVLPVVGQQDPLVHFNKGLDYFNLKEYKKAVEEYDVAIGLDPNLYYIYASRADAKVELGDLQGALDDFNAYKRIVEELNLLGDAEILDKRNKLISAQGGGEKMATTTAESTSAGDASSWYVKGKMGFESGDHTGAIRDFTNAIQLDEKYVAAYLGRGFTYLKMRDVQAAYRDFNKAIQIDPSEYNAYIGRGESKDKLRNFAGAIEDFNTAIQLAPAKPTAFYDRALVFFNQKNYLKSEEDFSSVLRLNNKHEKAYFNRGVTRMNQGKTTEACLDFKMAQSLGHLQAQEYLGKFCK